MGEQQLNETLRVIVGRKSVRHYTDEPVWKDALELIVRAGMAAPSAVNCQPWEFVVVTERETLHALAEGLEYARMLDSAGAAIVVCGVPDKTPPGTGDYWVQDCSAATQNILLAIESLGLGAVWTGVYPRRERVAHVRKVLKVPEGVIPLNVIPIGWPVGDEDPKDKYVPEKVHWERWQGARRG